MMEKKRKNTAVLFDVDDTLYDQTAPFKEAYAQYFGEKPSVPADVIYPVIRKYSDRVYFRAMSGEMTMQELYVYRVQSAFEEFGLHITEENASGLQSVYEERQHKIRMTPLMQEILTYCAEKAELGIITNGPSRHQWDKVRSLDVSRWIADEHVFVSGDIGIQKPQRGIFDYAKRAMRLEDARIWFVGDAYALDMKGAMNAGWGTVWMNRRANTLNQEDARPVCEVHSEKELAEALEKILDGETAARHGNAKRQL